jgi:hypothetical protein
MKIIKVRIASTVATDDFDDLAYTLTDDWFERMTPDEQKEYTKKHPGSRHAKTHARSSHKASVPTKKKLGLDYYDDLGVDISSINSALKGLASILKKEGIAVVGLENADYETDGEIKLKARFYIQVSKFGNRGLDFSFGKESKDGNSIQTYRDTNDFMALIPLIKKQMASSNLR